MDILDGSTSPDTTSDLFNLTDMVDTTKPVTGLPQGAIRNRAATSAILQGDPNKVVDSYQVMVNEGENGQSDTHNQIIDNLATANKGNSMAQVINILGDRSVPLEQKNKLLNFVSNNSFKEEPSTTLQTNALIAPSKGENLRGEAARISTADVMAEMQQSREERQKQLNGLIASLPDASTNTVGEFLATDIAPFGRNVIGAKVAGNFAQKNNEPLSVGQWVKNFLLPGSTKKDLQDKLNSVPLAARPAYTEKLLSSIKESAAVFHSDNYFAQYQTAVDLLEHDISNTEAWVGNMQTVLDGFWVGSAIKAGKTALSTAERAGAPRVEPTMGGSGARRPGSANPGTSDVHPDDIVHKADWEVVGDPYNPNQLASGRKRITNNPTDTAKRLELGAPVRRENPVSPYSTIEQVNPEQAREMHLAIVNGSDELAQAMTGVSKEQALANNTMPQVATESDAVLNKVNQTFNPAFSNTGALRYTEQELAGAVDTVTRDFRAASGLEINDAMTTFRVDGDHLVIDAHYATSGGTWVTPEAAKAQAKYALRQYGIRDDEVVVMQRNGMDYVPATGTDASDYIIKVKTRHPISDNDVQSWNPLDVKRNWLNRISQTGSDDFGSAAGWLMDPGSMLHPTITGSASVATDQAITMENFLLRPIRELRDKIGGFPKDRRFAVEEYMKEANTNGLKHDPFVLRGRGFNDTEIEALKDWRNIWDGHYYLENNDLVRTMNSQGYHVMETATDKLFGKAVPKNANIGRVYDPATGTVTTLDKAAMDTLYNSGGSYAKFRRSVVIGGDEIEHFVVRNSPSQYLRKIRDTDAILNYREGYYTVNYKAPKFVDEVTINSAGKEVRRTVGVAGNTKDADMFAQAQEASTGNRHIVREDARGFRKDGDGYWDLNEASGRIAQRMRGKPLTQATGTNNLGVGPYVENPMESAVRAAQSLAGRTMTRPMLETAKKRFIDQYGEFLKPVPYGPKEFPSSRNEIVDAASHTSSKVADARTTWDYIRFLENGYINSADEIFKGGMNVLADILGKYHLSTGERAARAVGDLSLAHSGKKTVFQAYIAMSNPIRQWIVQSHQVGRTMAYNPVGWATGAVPDRIIGYLGIQSTLTQGGQLAKDFTKFVEESGMVAGVDKNSLVRGMGLGMADSSYGAKKLLAEVVSVPQRVGFDLGEKMNQLGHLAAVHEKYTRAGMNLADKTVRDRAMSEARALSYDLNKAGELHYTQGSAALVLQFLQMPQKALLQATNRRLPFDVKARMFGWDMVMFGLPTSIIGAIAYATGGDKDDSLPDDPKIRDMVVTGLEAYSLNRMFSMMDDSGEQSRIDLSALSPYDLDGWARMYSSFMDKGYFAALAASPAGQVFAVDGTNNSTRNGRIPQALLTMGRYFNVVEEMDPQNPTEFTSVLKDVANISSGWNAASKASIMLETRKKFDSMGVTVDSTITTPEIYAAFLGFGTRSTKELYEISQSRQQAKKDHEKEVMSKYRDIVRYYSQALNTENPDVEHIQKVSSMLMRTFTDPADLRVVTKQWQQDMVGKEQQLFRTMITAAGMPNTERLLDDIKKLPVDQNVKDALTQRVKDFKSQREFNKENK